MSYQRYDAKEYLAKRLMKRRPEPNWIGRLFPHLGKCKSAALVGSLYPEKESDNG